MDSEIQKKDVIQYGGWRRLCDIILRYNTVERKTRMIWLKAVSIWLLYLAIKPHVNHKIGGENRSLSCLHDCIKLAMITDYIQLYCSYYFQIMLVLNIF